MWSACGTLEWRTEVIAKNTKNVVSGLSVGLLLLFVTSTSLVQAEIFKWVDADGNVHYGDKPTGASSEADNAEQVDLPKQQTVPMTSPERQRRQQKYLQSFTEERERKEKAKQAAAAAAAKTKKKCEAARKKLHRYQHARYLYRKDEQGNKVVADDAEHARVMANAEAAVKKHCGKQRQ